MGQNRSISDPNRVQMGSNRVKNQFRLIRNHFQPKRTNGDPKQPISHFLEGRFWVDFRHFRRTRPTRPTFRKMVGKWVRYFFGTEFPHRRELRIDGVEMSNGATADLFRPDKLLGFWGQNGPGPKWAQGGPTNKQQTTNNKQLGLCWTHFG